MLPLLLLPSFNTSIVSRLPPSASLTLSFLNGFCPSTPPFSLFPGLFSSLDLFSPTPLHTPFLSLLLHSHLTFVLFFSFHSFLPVILARLPASNLPYLLNFLSLPPLPVPTLLLLHTPLPFLVSLPLLVYFTSSPYSFLYLPTSSASFTFPILLSLTLFPCHFPPTPYSLWPFAIYIYYRASTSSGF